MIQTIALVPCHLRDWFIIFAACTISSAFPEGPGVCIQPHAGIDAHWIHLLDTGIVQDPAK